MALTLIGSPVSPFVRKVNVVPLDGIGKRWVELD